MDILSSLFLIVCSSLSYSYGQIYTDVAKSPAGGYDAKITAGHTIGTPDHNLGAGVFAAGNTEQRSPESMGAFANYNLKNLGLGVSHTNVPGYGTIDSQNARLNIFQDDKHKFDANAFHTKTNLENSLSFDKYGGGLDYNHHRGHGASVGVSHIPQFGGTTMDLAGKANVWKSQDHMTNVDLTGSYSRTFGGIMDGRTNAGVGIGLEHRF